MINHSALEKRQRPGLIPPPTSGHSLWPSEPSVKGAVPLFSGTYSMPEPKCHAGSGIVGRMGRIGCPTWPLRRVSAGREALQRWSASALWCDKPPGDVVLDCPVHHRGLGLYGPQAHRPRGINPPPSWRHSVPTSTECHKSHAFDSAGCVPMSNAGENENHR